MAVLGAVLLARAVLRGSTKGYRHHPQLERFKTHRRPRSAISTYLAGIYAEAAMRGYSFDHAKVGNARTGVRIPVTEGQLAFEWEHLLRKMSVRSPSRYRQWRSTRLPRCHPLMRRCEGPIEPWERP